jgi:hypothetical protein
MATRDEKRLAQLTSVLDSYGVKLPPELKVALAGAQGYDDYIPKRLQIHHIFFASILDPVIGHRSWEEQAAIIKGMEKKLRGTKLYNNIENLIPLVKELHLNDILSSHNLIDALRKSGDLAKGGKVFGFKGKQLVTTGQGGGITFAKSWNMKSKHGFSLEQMAKFREMTPAQLVDATAGWVDLSHDYFKQVNLVSAALSPDQLSRDWAQYLVNNTQDGERLLNEGLEQIVENNNLVRKQFEGLSEAALDNLKVPEQKLIGRANEITKRVNQYSSLGPLKNLPFQLKGTPAYEGVESIEDLIDIYHKRVVEGAKPKEIQKMLVQYYKDRGVPPSKILRMLQPTPLDQAAAYTAGKAKQLTGKAFRLLPYSDEAAALFKGAVATSLGKSLLTGLPGSAGYAFEHIDRDEQYKKLEENPKNPLNWFQVGVAEIATGTAKDPKPLSQGINLGANVLQLTTNFARSRLGRSLYGEFAKGDGTILGDMPDLNEQSREETAEIPEQSTTVLDQGESAEDIEEELKVGVSNFN